MCTVPPRGRLQIYQILQKIGGIITHVSRRRLTAKQEPCFRANYSIPCEGMHFGDIFEGNRRRVYITANPSVGTDSHFSFAQQILFLFPRPNTFLLGTSSRSVLHETLPCFEGKLIFFLLNSVKKGDILVSLSQK